MATSKLKTRSKSKPSAKAKAKTKLKSKSKLVKKLKPGKVAKAKSKSKPKLKAALKKFKTRIKPKPKSKPKSKSKSKALIVYSNIQKAALLATITKINNLHKSDKDGLKSLTQIDRIIDKYNQHYTKPNEKLDAIVQYGMNEDPIQIGKNYYLDVQPKEKETADLYLLLLEVGKGKTKFLNIKNKINKLHKDSLKSRKR